MNSKNGKSYDKPFFCFYELWCGSEGLLGVTGDGLTPLTGDTPVGRFTGYAGKMQNAKFVFVSYGKQVAACAAY